MQLVAVWPLTKGVKGIIPSTEAKTTLRPFAKGFMFEDAAKKAADKGEVQIMLGLSTSDLKAEGDVVVPIVKETVKETKSILKRKAIQNKKKKDPSDDMLD